MKKIFLLFGITAFSAASAQQKDLFDIQQHLQKKQVETKKAAEKKVNILPFKRQLGFNNLIPGINPERSYTLPNGDKVTTSRLDNMPCVRPDMQNFQVMPNLATGSAVPGFNYYPHKILPGQIPNAAPPYRMLASK